MSTESATVLFTDVVGSSELSQRLSPEAADEVRREHFSILRQAIASVGLRVGLSGGEVTEEDDDYFGDPGRRASPAVCHQRERTGSGHGHRIAGRRNRHQCRSVGELALKGLPDPAETVEVLWEPIGGVDPAATTP